MKYFLETPGGRQLEIEVEEIEPGRYRVRLDGREMEAQFDDVDRLGQYAARIGTRSFAASIEEHSLTDLTVNLAGETFRFTALDQRERDASAVGASRRPRLEVVTAPIPGIVVAVRAAVGERVEPGQPLLVLEAMKMQNEIASSHGGVVEEVLVAEGDAVALNQALLRVGPADDSEA